MPIFQPGTHIASFVVIRHIGSGGVADVYEVLTPGGGRYALKVLLLHGALDEKPAARFRQEAELIATIEHVGVVGFVDAGHDPRVGEHGCLWILIELVEGPNLRRLVEGAGGALPVARAVSIVRQACDAVAAAHDLGIVHRDLRPENILVANRDVAKVTDFGSAKPEAYGVKTTNGREWCGALYSAPGQPGPAADVYTMGVILYEIIAGVYPIGSPEVAPATIFCLHIHQPPTPLEALGRDVPGDLSMLVQWTLTKDPAGRPSMRQLADALRLVLARLNVPRRALARAILPNRLQGHEPTERMPVVDLPTPPPPGAAPAALAPPSTPAQQARVIASTPATERAAAPPVPPWAQPSTLRSPSSPQSSVPAGMPCAPRASTGIPVESTATVRASSGAPQARRAAVAWVGALLLFVLLGTGWMLLGHALPAPTSAAPAPEPSATPPSTPAGAAPPVPAGAALPATSAGAAPAPTAASASASRPRAPAAPARPRPAPPRSRLPF